MKGVFTIIIDEKMKYRARNVNIAEYLIAKGENLIKEGSRYRHDEHRSLVFDGYRFYWNSRNITGNSIDFVMLYYNLSFIEAIKELLNPEFSKTSTNYIINSEKMTHNNVQFDFNSIKMNKDMRRTWAYLCKTRGIERNIVSELIKKKLLFQELDKRNVFTNSKPHHKPIFKNNKKVFDETQ